MNCLSCHHKIHHSAPVCPHCGRVRQFHLLTTTMIQMILSSIVIAVVAMFLRIMWSVLSP